MNLPRTVRKTLDDHLFTRLEHGHWVDLRGQHSNKAVSRYLIRLFEEIHNDRALILDDYSEELSRQYEEPSYQLFHTRMPLTVVEDREPDFTTAPFTLYGPKLFTPLPDVES